MNTKTASDIANALEELNFPIRGHSVEKHFDYDVSTVIVSDMNVPAIADCKFIAKEYGVLFYVDELFNKGIFEIC